MSMTVLDNGVERQATQAEILDIQARQVQAIAPVPASVTMLQARLSLIAAGLLAEANAFILAMPGMEGDKARTVWEYAQSVVRHDPLVEVLANHLGLSNAQTDQLFIAASNL